ncbi:MAG: hypothetical protein MK060_11780 [Blastomonas sp.]|uniref:hypothetical protein n=1 Tax=unclassified Blastomonas TaxID=2626550 RepID=UPI0010F4C32B|nr:hypothetical protein [Blastomonas sp.]MCH2238553.1 hypothetical protein [Blastomonas sp.]
MKASLPPRWAMICWALLIFGLIGFLSWAGREGKVKQISQAQPVLYVQSSLQSHELAECISQRFPLTDRRFSMVDNNARHVRRWNEARGVRIDIIDRGSSRLLEIATPKGRKLRKQERNAIRECAAGG